MAKFTVAIPSAGRVESLVRTIHVVCSFLKKNDQFEVLVVENGVSRPDDRLISIANEFKGFVRIIAEETPGLLAGRHRAVEESSGEVICFLDDDVDISPTWVFGICEAFEDESLVLAGGPSVADCEASFPEWVDALWQPICGHGRVLGCLSLIDLDVAFPCDIHPAFVFGLNFAIRKNALIKLGGFHPDCVPVSHQHFQGDGESGLSFKVAETGAKCIYHPMLKVVHRLPATRLTVRYFENRMFYQGVCDSYTKIRKELRDRCQGNMTQGGRKAIGLLQHLIRRFSSVHQDNIIPTNSALGRLDKTIHSRLNRAYQQGMEFHESCAKSSGALRNWIAKDDYFNYAYPVLEEGLCLPAKVVFEADSSD